MEYFFYLVLSVLTPLVRGQIRSWAKFAPIPSEIPIRFNSLYFGIRFSHVLWMFPTLLKKYKKTYCRLKDAHLWLGLG